MMFNLYLKSLKSRTAKARQFCFDGLFELCNAFSNTRMKVFGDPQSLTANLGSPVATANLPQAGYCNSTPVGPYWCVMVYWLVVSQWKGLSRILWKIKNVWNHQPVYHHLHYNSGEIDRFCRNGSSAPAPEENVEDHSHPRKTAISRRKMMIHHQICG